MNPSIICREVRPEIRNGQEYLVIVASQDERTSERWQEVTDPTTWGAIKARLTSQGIALGEASLALKPSVPSRSDSTIQLAATDDRGRIHGLIADGLEAYSLSSGSTLSYFFVPNAPGDFHWLVGRHVDVQDVEMAG